MRREISVRYEGRPCYKITLNDAFDMLGSDISDCTGDVRTRKICIVSDSNVAKIYADKIVEILSPICRSVFLFEFAAGEQSKNLDVVQELYEYLIINHFDRHDFLLALGGGVVGDLAGFGAATFLRGIDFIQVPTSLLAQADSSIGGKTGVDFRQYKNMVGAFHQPRLVYMAACVFSTLPDAQFANGMAEEIKHGLIRDRAFYEWIRDDRQRIQKKDPEALLHLLEAGCNVKREVVENDPKEKGERALLNFGHTVGHAIEKLSGFKLAHGECVSLGMVAAARLSVSRGLIAQEDLDDIKRTLEAYRLPITIGGLTPEKVLAATKSDKKMSAGKIRFILLRHIGEAYADLSVNDGEMMDAIAYVLE